MQSGFVERLQRRLRDECLNEHLFANLNEARNTVEEWRTDYNTNRPHSSLKWAHTNRFRSTPRGGA